VVDYIDDRYDVELNENCKICQYRSLTHSYKLTVGICICVYLTLHYLSLVFLWFIELN